MRRWVALGVVSLAVVSALPAKAASIAWHSCAADATAGSAAAMDCGWLRPGDTLAGAPVRLRVVVLRARPDRRDEQPVVYLPGGPGSAAGLDPASLRGWRAWQQRAGWRHDIVLFDPRGTGGSRPRPACPTIRAARGRAAGKPLGSDREFADEARAARRCYQALGPPQAAALGPKAQLRDLDALIDALHVDRVDLWGVSYGTRIARLYAAHHTARVAAMVLDSLFPFERDDLLALPAQIGGAIAALDSYCRNHAPCAEDDREPSALVHSLLDRYAGQAPTLEVADSSGRSRSFAVTPYRLLMMVLLAGYDAHNAADTIARLRRADGGAPAALAPLTDRLWRQARDDSRSEAVFWSTRCAFGDAVPTQKAWRQALSAYPEIAAYLAPARKSPVCDVWRVPQTMPPGANTRLRVPTLVVAGASDVVTPSRWARHFTALHPEVRQLRVAGAGHVATFTSDCALQAVAVFWQSPPHADMPRCD